MTDQTISKFVDPYKKPCHIIDYIMRKLAQHQAEASYMYVWDVLESIAAMQAYVDWHKLQSYK